MKIIMLFGLIALAGCASKEELAACSGPVFALNTGKWQPAPADLQAPVKSGSEK